MLTGNLTSWKLKPKSATSSTEQHAAILKLMNKSTSTNYKACLENHISPFNSSTLQYWGQLLRQISTVDDLI